ncbi:MAG: phage tail protein [Burkholderiaceae bacterium]|jgi:hypothetical protein|nr:phage tail protein [Burkholderiaceae bacterium]
MAYYFAEGSKFYFSTSLASPKTVTILSNANPALATATGHGYSDNDEVLLTSGWEDATDTVYRVDQQSADTFLVLGLNSSDTDWYASGTGTGTAEKLSSWVEIPQVLNITSSGGDARFTNVEPLSKRNSLAVPTGFNPSTITLTLGHDPSLAAYQTMLDISRTLAKVAFKVVISGGGTGYGYGYLSVSEMPQLARNQTNQVQAAIGLLGRFITYTT